MPKLTRNEKIGLGIGVGLSIILIIIVILIIVLTENKTETKTYNTNTVLLFGVVRMFPDDTWEQLQSNGTVKKGKGVQKKLDLVYTIMGPKSAEFTTDRSAIAFMPGTYNLNFQVGYYTSIFGLGVSPDDVLINGTINVPNDVTNPESLGSLDNFWRSLENLHLNIIGGDKVEYFSCSQAAPIRRCHITGGTLNLAKFAGGAGGDPSLGGYASGGFMSDTKCDGDIDLQTQQQYFWSNSEFKTGLAGAWVFLTVGCVGDYDGKNVENRCVQNDLLFTTVNKMPLMAEKPFLVFEKEHYKIVLPPLLANTKGVGDWRAVAKTISDFSIVKDTDTVQFLNELLSKSISLIFPPGIYEFAETLKVTSDNVIIIGLGYATIKNTSGLPCIQVQDGLEGVRISSLLIDAGEVSTPVLVQIGVDPDAPQKNLKNPHLIQDMFCRTLIGSECGTMLEINSKGTLLQHAWLWAADHTENEDEGLGPDVAVSQHGLVVNASDVKAYAIFSEHHSKENVLWTGSNGKLFFLQSEFNYWSAAVPEWDFPSLRVTGNNFFGTNLAAYSFFANKWGATNIIPTIKNAFLVPEDAQIESCETVFLNADRGNGRILNVINFKGQESNIENADKKSLCGLNGTNPGYCSVNVCETVIT